jgi:uncharacterized protein (TIGR03083 family)
MGDDLDYLALIADESLRFAAAIRAAGSDARVPSCPDWDADDLLWHLAEVQWFWAEVVRSRADEPGPVEARKPARPTDRPGLEAFLAGASSALLDALTADPGTPVWTWADDRSVGFVRRRQAHEALIHRVDAELAVGARTPIGSALAADGVDEALRVMLGGLPDWGTFTPLDVAGASSGAPTVRVRCTDTGHSWLAAPGTFTGTSPSGDESWTDESVVQVMPQDDGGPSAATIAGSSADLDCLLWNRPALGPVQRSGHPVVLAAFDAVVAEGIQ